MDHLRALALSIAEGRQAFRWLDVPPLLKHTIGLRRGGHTFELLLFWYSSGEDTRETAEMERELAVLHEEMFADKVSFRALTYQALFQSLRAQASSLPDAADYLTYLTDRYFGGEP